MKRNIPGWVLCLFTGCLLSYSAVFGQYQIIDLGTLSSGDASSAYSINNKGQIVGFSNIVQAHTVERAVLFDTTGEGNNIDLRIFYPMDSNAITEAYAVSTNGLIVGMEYDNSSDCHAVIFDASGGGNNIDIGNHVGYFGFGQSCAYAVNGKNHIVGYDISQSGASHATLFDETGGRNNIDLGTLGGTYSWAYSINNNGKIVGAAENNLFHDCATIFDATGSGNNTSLGTLPGYQSSIARSINDNNMIVGLAFNNLENETRAALFDASGNGQNIDLGTIPNANGRQSQAYSLNNKNQIVGWAYIDNYPNSCYHAVLFDPSGAGNNIDLNTLLPEGTGWILEKAYSINDNGWIVGGGTNPSGQSHAFLLKPIPEPCTLALLALGGVALLRKRRA